MMENKDYIELKELSGEELFKEYIDRVRWQEAKTYAKTAPHEYTIRSWRMDIEEIFERVVMFIRENGREEAFYHKTYIYYYLDGYKYWTMGDPLNDTVVLNRVEV